MTIEMTLAIANLVESLKNDDLNTTIELTNYINNNITQLDEELNSVLFGDGNFPIIHDSLDYLLENALFLKDTDVIVFRRKIKRIVKNRDKDAIKKFIQDFFSNKIQENLVEYKSFYIDLISMGNLLEDKDLYLKIKEYIQQKGEIN